MMYPQIAETGQFVYVPANQPKLQAKEQPAQVKQTQHILANEELETPSQSLAFLELYHKSAMKVETFSANLRKVSIFAGVFASLGFIWALMSFMASQNQLASSHTPKSGPHQLRSSLTEDNIGDDISSLSSVSSTFSMLIWGLVMAKVKSGFNASSSKDHMTVKSGLSKILGLTALIALATLAKLNSDNHYLENLMESQRSPQDNAVSPRQLRASSHQEPVKSSIDILEQLGNQWRQQLKKNEKKVAADEPSFSDDVEETGNSSEQEQLEQLKLAAQKYMKVLYAALLCGFTVSYVVFYRDYQLVLEKHQQLTDLLNNPNVRVASGDKAQKALLQIQAMQKPVEPTPQEKLQRLQQIHLGSANPASYQSPIVSAPTFQNLPPTRKDSNAFTYSLCDSIDYQHESIKQPHSYAPQPVLQQNSNLYTLEQVQSLLNKQKEELMVKSTKIQQAPQVVVMSKADFQKKFNTQVNDSLNASLLDEEANVGTFRLTNLNSMK